MRNRFAGSRFGFFAEKQWPFIQTERPIGSAGMPVSSNAPSLLENGRPRLFYPQLGTERLLVEMLGPLRSGNAILMLRINNQITSVIGTAV